MFTCIEYVSFESHLCSARAKSNLIHNDICMFYRWFQSPTTIINKLTFFGISIHVAVVFLMCSAQNNCIDAFKLENDSSLSLIEYGLNRSNIYILCDNIISNIWILIHRFKDHWSPYPHNLAANRFQIYIIRIELFGTESSTIYY